MMEQNIELSPTSLSSPFLFIYLCAGAILPFPIHPSSYYTNLHLGPNEQMNAALHELNIK